MHQPITAITALVLALTGLSLPGASATAARVPVSIVHGSSRNGFDWGDAGIGAAAGAGITLLGLGGALAVSQRHAHPNRRTAGRIVDRGRWIGRSSSTSRIGGHPAVSPRAHASPEGKVRLTRAAPLSPPPGHSKGRTRHRSSPRQPHRPDMGNQSGPGQRETIT